MKIKNLFYAACVCLITAGTVVLFAQGAPHVQDEKEAQPKEAPRKEIQEKEKSVDDAKTIDISDQELERKFEIISRVIDIISKYYVEPVNRQKLVEGALKGIMAELDPYSAFLTTDDMEEMHIDLKGELQGIGVYITLDENNVLTVITPIEGTPAFNAGVMSGDKILEIDGESTKNFSLHDAVKRIRGPEGTEIKLTVYHVDLGERETLAITRERIPILSVKETRIVDEEGKIGFIRLTSFQENTKDEMTAALQELDTGGMKGLVLDLRDNGGGLLSSAIQVADLFLSRGIIVSVKGRNGKAPRPPWTAQQDKTVTDVPVVVLINNYSASASEILAAALRDNHRAILVGEKTFGKGSVQKLIALKDASGIKLTIQRYYTPSGISIDKKGIQPDIKEKMSIETKMWILNKRREELINKNKQQIEKNKQQDEKTEGDEGESPDSGKKPYGRDPEVEEAIQYINELKAKDEKEEKEFIDTQLQRAVDILKGMQVLEKQLGRI